MKCQAFTILQLNVVYLDTRKMIIFNNLCSINDNFDKKWWLDELNFTTRHWLVDWQYYDETIMFSDIWGCLQDFNKCCRSLLFPIEYDLEYNNIEAKVLSPNSWYKQVGSLCL